MTWWRDHGRAIALLDEPQFRSFWKTRRPRWIRRNRVLNMIVGNFVRAQVRRGADGVYTVPGDWDNNDYIDRSFETYNEAFAYARGRADIQKWEKVEYKTFPFLE